ncbi:hypothetical protein GCM10007276_33760 [Agaricicola taiwanensis]|uniref:Thioredoxin reductase n=1 Tax=Agaricicola taiwanensis TaxID=591372 RepID=A0A8J3E1G2_9RHOB|nr:NAD(P)/FAD-dependent oxidoreductase [Agaricicola taiwanensis]GGE53911.1 hypothetical protein GCM10007276_33760 [Agaricicola taiwanensis]
MKTETRMIHDVIIVGGSYAGLAAALQLARARRKVLVIDGGSPRNRFAKSSHGFLGQDGRAPGDILADARAQLMAYPTVNWLDANADKASAIGHDFHVTAAGKDHEAQRLILATGVCDELPAIPGLAERWGVAVFHCPYCHGYELDQGSIGVLATSEGSMHHALMLPDWGETIFFLNGAFTPDEEQAAELKRRGAKVETTRIRRISGERADVELEDGRVISLCGLFTLTRTSMASPLAEQLGCAFEEGPLGPYIQTNEFKETSVQGVYACGDAARPAGAVALAVGDGTLAGTGVHQSIIFHRDP